jgi:tetratricopeptide (TPR) repeat protein
MSRLAWIYYHTGDSAQAKSLSAEAVAAARDHSAIDIESHAIALHVLARMTGREGNVAEGERLLRRSVDLVKAELGDQHPQTLKAKNRLAAYLYDHRIKLDEAEQLYRSALAHNRRILGESHPTTLLLHGNLVLLYWAQERYEPALLHQLKVLEFTRTQPDPTAIEVFQELWEAAPLKGLAGARLSPSSQWRMNYSPPLSTWTALEFDDRSWSTDASAEATEAWLRVPFELDAVPRGVPIILIPNQGDYEIYLNGVPARTGPVGKGDRFQLVIVDPQARTGLRPGRNVLALHARKLPSNKPFTIELYEAPAEIPLP